MDPRALQLPETRRRFPRADLRVKARLSISGDPRRRFEATLPTTDISVGGIFFESTFFLKIGMKLEVSLELPPSGRLVRAQGTVVRVVTLQPNGRGRSGFAVKFSGYLDGSEVVLANFFLAPVLREFIHQYAKKHRFQTNPEYVAHMADLLSAWELSKAEGLSVSGWSDHGLVRGGRPAPAPALLPGRQAPGRPGVGRPSR
ncbi:MAG: PilZ domain-containing protein [Myxococcaceae bacterium]